MRTPQRDSTVPHVAQNVTSTPTPTPSTPALPAPVPPISAAAPAGPGPYHASIAHTEEQIRAAQRLRHRVFAEEMGAALDTPLPGHDIDAFDAVADHLVVTETASREVVGTYRLLPPGRTQLSYSEAEFDLSSLAALRPSMIEAGRSCVHPDHRSGAVINLMWSALARYVLLSGHRYLAGCASVPLADGGAAAAHAWLLGNAQHSSPPELRVHPRRPWLPAAPAGGRSGSASLPPLLRGYFRLGAWMCGAPTYDPDFHVADFFVLLDMDRLGDRYRRFFLGDVR
ncbi:GNAT family N-acetyltransferase [Streptomyces sp. NPDC048111]|uniref:GNAT family N-acetyltransferase n=1 Tax=Streptomyces sp. NPDC048111 TaxID=3365500 RepID=UPI00371FB13F